MTDEEVREIQKKYEIVWIFKHDEYKDTPKADLDRMIKDLKVLFDRDAEKRKQSRKCFVCKHATVANHNGWCWCNVLERKSTYSRSPLLADGCNDFERAEYWHELCNPKKCKDAKSGEFCDTCRFEWLTAGMLEDNGEMNHGEL